MTYMFYQAENFNQPIGKWNVSNVIDMSSMFAYAINFNQNLNKWTLNNLVRVSRMFWDAINLDKLNYKETFIVNGNIVALK